MLIGTINSSPCRAAFLLTLSFLVKADQWRLHQLPQQEVDQETNLWHVVLGRILVELTDQCLAHLLYKLAINLQYLVKLANVALSIHLHRFNQI